jgi:hypothetical protein
MTGNSATTQRISRGGRARRGFPQDSLGEVSLGVAATDCFCTVKIPHFPRPARSFEIAPEKRLWQISIPA